jgi:glutathione S-transferase
VKNAAVRLYVDAQFASPYAMSVFVALIEKDVAFTSSTVDLSAGENRTAVFADRSLTQRVPTLEHGDVSLTESSAITEYLDEVFPGAALYPSELRARARARQIQAWLRSDLMALRVERPTEVVFYGAKCPPLTAAGQSAANKLVSVGMATLAEQGEHIGAQWSLADLDLALMIQRLALHGDRVPARLGNYAKKQWQRASVQRWLNLERPGL